MRRQLEDELQKAQARTEMLSLELAEERKRIGRLRGALRAIDGVDALSHGPKRAQRLGKLREHIAESAPIRTADILTWAAAELGTHDATTRVYINDLAGMGQIEVVGREGNMRLYGVPSESDGEAGS